MRVNGAAALMACCARVLCMHGAARSDCQLFSKTSFPHALLPFRLALFGEFVCVCVNMFSRRARAPQTRINTREWIIRLESTLHYTRDVPAFVLVVCLNVWLPQRSQREFTVRTRKNQFVCSAICSAAADNVANVNCWRTRETIQTRSISNQM